MASGDYPTALESLRDHRDEPGVQTIWQEAVDGYVHAERERAGNLYVRAREMPEGEVRDAAVNDVVEVLKGLLRDYPESSYVDALERNLELVRE